MKTHVTSSIISLNNGGDTKISFPIYDPQFFDRYFALLVSKVDVREETVERFVNDKNSRAYIIQSTAADGSVGSLLARLKTKRTDLAAINPLIRWKPETESQFVSCRYAFLEVLAHIIDANGDFAHGTNYLMNIMPGDDGFFNPAKFYLIYYFNSLVFSDKKSLFFKHLDVIANHGDELKKMEQDLLKRYASDHLIFQRPHTRTDFFHKLFLIRYNEIFPGEYLDKLKTYIDKQENFFIFLRFIINSENTSPERVDVYSLPKLLYLEILDAMVNKTSKIIVPGLTEPDQSILKTFREVESDIRLRLQEVKT